MYQVISVLTVEAQKSFCPLNCQTLYMYKVFKPVGRNEFRTYKIPQIKYRTVERKRVRERERERECVCVRAHVCALLNDAVNF